MVKWTASSALVFLALLTGCGQAPDQPAGNETASSAPRKITIRNEWQEKLLKLSDNDRDLTLRRAIRDDGGSCSKISGSKYQQPYKSMEMWVAHCSSGDWAVFIAASGDVQARACTEIPQLNRDTPQLKLPTCHPWPVDPSAPVDETRWPTPEPARPKPIDKL
jgi:hypothetical protein